MMGYAAQRRQELDVSYENVQSYAQKRKAELQEVKPKTEEPKSISIDDTKLANDGHAIQKPQKVTIGSTLKALHEVLSNNKVPQGVIRRPIVNAISQSNDFVNVAGQSMRGVVFGDSSPLIGEATTTGNKTADAIAKAAGGLESVFIPSGDAALPVNVIRNAAENAVNKAAVKTGSKVLGKDVVKKAATGAVESLPYTAEQIAVQKNTTPKETVKTAVANMALGAAAEPLLMAAGVLAKKASSALTKNKGIAADVPASIKQEQPIKAMEQPANGTELVTGNSVQAVQQVKEIGQVNAPSINKVDQNGVQEVKRNSTLTMDEAPSVSPKTPEDTKFVEQYTASLPNDENGLNKVIADLDSKISIETDIGRKWKLNLQRFSVGKKLEEISKFRTNTIERWTKLTPEEKQFLPEEDFSHTPEEGTQWEAQAVRNLQADTEGTKQKIISSTQMSKVQEYEAAKIASDELKQARQKYTETGDKSAYGEFAKWMQVTTARTSETARALKATDLAWEKQSAEQAIKKSQRIVDGVEDAIKKTQPVKMKHVDEGLKKIKTILEDGTLTPQEAVNRIKMIINPKGKSGKVTMDKIIQIVNDGKKNGKIDYDGIKMILKEKNGIPVLTNEDIAEIDRLYSEAAKHPVDSYENRMFTEKARKLVEDKMPTDFIDKYRTIQRIMMLLNPKTLITRNPVGNILLQSLSQIKENTLGAFVDMFTSAIRGSERTTMAMPIEKLKATAQGVKKGITEFGYDIKNNIDTNPTHGQMELQKSRAFKGNNPVSRVIDTMDTVTKRVLQLGDRPAYEAAYASRMTELKRIKKTSTVTDEMKIDAKAYALDKVFQRDSELSKIFGNIKNASNNVGFKVLANTVMPFSQTPANVLDKMLEYSPVGIGKAIKELAIPKNGVFNQKYFVDNLSSGLTGTGILVVGYIMAQNGMIETKAPISPKERSFKQMEGKGNYALNFNGKYYTIDWAQPVATMLLAGAEAFKGGEKGEDKFKQVLNSITAGGDTFFNMSLLKNVSSLFGSGNSPMGSLVNTLVGSSTQFTQSSLKQVAQIIDPYVRDTYDPNMLKEQYNKILARIPGASKTLPAKKDTLGNDIKAYQGRNNLFNVFLNPGFYTEKINDPVINEIRRLFDAEKNTDVLPGKEALISGKFTFKKNGYTMTAKEKEKFANIYGSALQNGYTKNGTKFPGMNSFINSPFYKAKTTKDETRTSRIKAMYNKAYELARDEFLKSRGIKP